MLHRRRPPRIQLTHEPGTAPGTIKSRKGGLAPEIELISYNSNELEEHKIEDVGDLPELIRDDRVNWINVNGLGHVATLKKIAELFKLHDLAMEDAVNLQQRAKVEDYEDHLFVVLRMVTLKEQLKSEQVSMFVGDRFVVTIQEFSGDCFDLVRSRIRKNRKRIRGSGPDYLMYALIDAVVDAYFPVVDNYGEKMEQIDSQLSDGRHVNFMEVLHHMRGDLMSLRRSIRPLRDELIHLLSETNSIIRSETQIFLRDCYDHTIQLIDLLDTYRELCSDLRDYYLSIVSNRMNEIMKVLTIIGTIFIPLSFIAGLYGMNFDTQYPGNMPELSWRYGYVYSLVVMVAVGIGLLVFVWKQGWLGKDKTPIDFDG